MIISCGDALCDLVAAPEAVAGAISLEGRVGGSTLNVALGLARLGAPAGYLAKNSTDVFGQRIESFLNANGVDTSLIAPSPRNSTLAIVDVGADGHPTYAFYTSGTADRSLEPRDLPETLPEAVRAVHVGSYSTAIEPTAGTLLALVRREAGRKFISYDPNIRLSIEPGLDHWRAQVAAFGACADLIKASDEDVASLYPDGGIEVFAQGCLGRGAGLVFVTLGPKGAVAFAADGRRAEVPGVAVRVVDTVGAGDTFQAAALWWLWSHDQLSRAALGAVDLGGLLRFATRAAAVTCSRRGADLPTLADLEG